ncbi:putative toxin-antitoxin system toxin component, PIN family [Cupriavidus sp. USMAHM13]|uniref:putative toxin-antitoxin system toxin component, PIN family n=1 Tax=Cupriavidus sp. USMAHM13 TaxID=1389192 RepID=UPI0008A6E094|nr:putative toxin-antitoxin system toxin component, PIN family [Cupriavidus sp. USMAHM13]AOY99279.1 putative toxin-antitoxin system toxin component, PIN family [Cupriavidus sp. USMAHM13]
MPSDPTAAPASPATRPTAPRVVLDSNIWVDLLVFRDPRVEPIRQALESGAIATVIRADCREELRRVLHYPQFARFAIDHAAALAVVDGFATLLPPPDEATAGAVRLPKCKDGDDQKFIELAHFSGAACLVSKDKAVLKLAGRLRRSSQVQVLAPAAFPAWLAGRDGAPTPG